MLLPGLHFWNYENECNHSQFKNKHGMDIETEMKTSPAGVRYASIS